MTARDALAEAERRLAAAGVETPRVDAEWLVAHLLGTTRSGLAARLDDEVAGLEPLLARREAREPLAYVLGEGGFRRLTLKTDARALVPRPETETLVERALALAEGIERPRILDVGVGSGAIALALADEHEGAQVVAVDSSERALALAGENLARASVNGRVRFVQGDLLSEVEGPFDLVVSNPPYVSPEEYATLQPEIRLYEPYEAVVGVGVGAKIAAGARALLVPGGRLVLECGDGQAAGLAEALRSLGYGHVMETRDLAGRDRVVEGRWDGS